MITPATPPTPPSLASLGLLAVDESAAIVWPWEVGAQPPEADGPACERIRVRGALWEGSCWSGYGQIRERIAEAVQRPELRAVALDLDCPGGTVTGIVETVQAIDLARRQRPDVLFVAYVRGMCTSAAIWIASACQRIVAVETARVGGVGGIVRYWDESGILRKMGATYHRFTSARTPLKAPEPGTPEGDAEAQRGIDSAGDLFLADIARLRGVGGSLDAVAAYYQQGRTLPAADALSAGWVDEVVSAANPGRWEWLMQGVDPDQDDDLCMVSEDDPTARRKCAAASSNSAGTVRQEGATMANPKPAEGESGIVQLSTVAHQELLARLDTLTQGEAVAKAALAESERKLQATQVAANDAATKLAGLESQVKVLAKAHADAEIRACIDGAVAQGKIAEGDRAKFTALAETRGLDTVKLVFENIPAEAAGPRVAMSSSAPPVDPATAEADARAYVAAEGEKRLLANPGKYAGNYFAAAREVQTEVDAKVGKVVAK